MENDHSDRELPRLRIVRVGDHYDLELDHDPDFGTERLMEILGTSDPNFVRGFLDQIIEMSARGGGPNGRFMDENKLNHMLAVIGENKPRDVNEAMLAAQMAKTNDMLMEFACRLEYSTSPEDRQSCLATYLRLAGLFADQMKTLKQYRTGGEQRVTVQHVSVSEGGQAIVGNVTQNARAGKDKMATSPLAIADSKSKPMPIIETDNDRVAVAAKRKARKT